MSDEQTSKGELIDRVMSEARAEAERLRSDARHSVEERRKTLEHRIAEIERGSEERIAEEQSRLSSRADAAIALAEGRAKLRMEGRIYRTVEEQARETLRELRGTPEYPGILAGWLVEAALGLGAESMIVSCPSADRPYVEQAIAAARAELEQRNEHVTLTFDREREHAGQGVVVHDVAGRRAFSNLVDDRIRRFGHEVRRIVYHIVIEDQDGRTDHR